VEQDRPPRRLVAAASDNEGRFSVDWYDITGEYHQRTFAHDCRLTSLRDEWQRELAALWRLEADVNNGAYLQFLSNWGRESYFYASQALKKIGAHKMADIIDRCQALVDEHFSSEGASHEQMQDLMPSPVIGRDGERIKDAGSTLPETVVERTNELSYEFMSYPDNIEQLGLSHYEAYIEGEGPC
jgi:hypothetical protein